MASKGFKLTVIAIAFVALMVLGFIATNLSLKGSVGSGTATIGGREPEPMIRFITENGTYVHYDVKSTNGVSLDIFLVTYDQFQNYQSNGTLTYLPEGSASSVTNLDLKVTLERIVGTYYLLIMSNSSASASFEFRYEQGPSPLVESWVLVLGIFGSWIGATILICLGLLIAFKK
jgi:hypothetical protein